MQEGQDGTRGGVTVTINYNGALVEHKRSRTLLLDLILTVYASRRSPTILYMYAHSATSLRPV